MAQRILQPHEIESLDHVALAGCACRGTAMSSPPAPPGCGS